MAWAIRYDDLLRRGAVGSQTDLARFRHVTQPRMTQILNLLHLAPDIQEETLFLPLAGRGWEPIHEHMLREVTALSDWRQQRQAWASICAFSQQP